MTTNVLRRPRSGDVNENELRRDESRELQVEWVSGSRRKESEQDLGRLEKVYVRGREEEKLSGALHHHPPVAVDSPSSAWSQHLQRPLDPLVQVQAFFFLGVSRGTGKSNNEPFRDVSAVRIRAWIHLLS